MPWIDGSYFEAVRIFLTGVGFSANTIVFTLGFIWTVRQLHNARVARENSELASLLARNTEGIKRYEENKYRLTALTLYFGKEIDGDIDESELKKYYWGCRFMFLEMLSLAYQAWLLNGRPPRFRGRYAGWNPVIRRLSIAIFSENKEMPEFFTEACKDIKLYIEDKNWYDPMFIDLLIREYEEKHRS